MASGVTLSKFSKFSKHCILIRDSIKGAIMNIFLTCLCLIPSHSDESSFFLRKQPFLTHSQTIFVYLIPPLASGRDL